MVWMYPRSPRNMVGAAISTLLGLLLTSRQISGDMYIGGYDLHLYCDHGSDKPEAGSCNATDENKFQDEFTGDNYRDCAQQARDHGWLIKKDGRVLCPTHSGVKPRHRIDPLLGETTPVTIADIIEHFKNEAPA